MVRFAFAGFAVLALAGACAAEDDNGPALVDLFARTCALRPALPSKLERSATALGFVSEGPVISPEMEGPGMDIIYSARLTKRGEKVSLSAYFSSADGPIVICSVSTVNVSVEALPGLIEKSLNVHDRTEEPTADHNHLRVSWRAGAAGGSDTFDMSAWQVSPQRAEISIKYQSGKQ